MPSSAITWTTDATNKRLTTLDVQSKGLTGTLEVSGLTNLETLWCPYNQLTSLNVSGLTSLQDLYCSNNQLTALNVSGLNALAYLDCAGNKLTALDVSGLNALENLYCYSNQLTSLDVSGLTALQYLYCFNNQLATLNVSGLTALRYLRCSDNKLTALDLTDLSQLDQSDFTGGSQSPASITMTWNATQYEATVALNNPTGMTTGFSYSGGKLIAASNANATTPFTVETNKAGFSLSGTLSLTYSGGGATTYAVSIGTFTGGSVSANKTHYTAGETVTLTLSPNTGYEPDALTTTPSVTLSGSGNTRTFTMPASNVTVHAAFRKTANQQAVEDAQYLIEHAAFAVAQATANSSSDVRSWLVSYINTLISSTGVSVSLSDVTVSGFNAATAGNAGNPSGTNGSFNFSVSLTQGGSSASASTSGTVTATAYTPMGIESLQAATTVRVHGSTLYITATTSGEAYIYNLSGQLVKTVLYFAGETATTQLPRGLYIVLTEGKTQKVVVQ